MSNFLEFLNENQKKAATFIDGPLLVLAGAGSGKTQTMISRLVYLISEVGIPPENILTLTFTNKAAASMRSRAIKMLSSVGFVQSLPILSTFHSFGMEFLENHISYLEPSRKSGFRIADSADKKELIKYVMLKLEKEKNPNFLDKKSSDHKKNKADFDKRCKLAAAYIEKVKNSFECNQMDEFFPALKAYEEELSARNLVDFDDLIFLPYKILKQNPALAKQCSEQYKYIMVDEYQDTNLAQLKLLKILCCEHSNIVVVGDDDQSIYSFRNARVENILGFDKDFLGAKIIKLEENYRSTKSILDCANKVIANNKERHGKTLFTKNQEDEAIERITSYAEVCAQIQRLKASGIEYKDICVLYRMNRSSNFFEPKLINLNIPYKVIGSVPFYSRAEIKLLLNYLHFYLDTNDNHTFKKIINAPKRKFGEQSIVKLENLANNQSLFETLKQNLHIFKHNEIKEFINIFEVCKNDLALFVKKMKDLEVYKMFENPEFRKENCDTFFQILDKELQGKENNEQLRTMLNKISLQENLVKEQSDAINLMSIHASKGLEYDYVFLIDCNYADMPSMHVSCSLEEERRLLYVAITRAKKKFFLHYDESKPSPFVGEIFSDICSDATLTNFTSTNYANITENTAKIKKNDFVMHKIFGRGQVLAVNTAIATVNFSGNIKKLNINFLQTCL